MTGVASLAGGQTAAPPRAAPRLTAAQRGVLASSMSDASCGLTLGRSIGWVARMRRDLADAAAPQAVPAPLTATEIAPAPKPEARSPKPEARSPGVCQVLTAVNRSRVEALREEFDLLCLPQPSRWRIAMALAEGRP